MKVSPLNLRASLELMAVLEVGPLNWEVWVEYHQATIRLLSLRFQPKKVLLILSSVLLDQLLKCGLGPVPQSRIPSSNLLNMQV
mmetsp:Transcript_4997/g.7696  ORF Transcript_4997/g.7696 Transcript_4997/m.7696 type:complete len:84 (-) Transcript_4997:423-674(-)